MPASLSSKNLTDTMPLVTYASASYQINGGTLIAAATAAVDSVAFTDTVTVTGVATTDKYLGISPRDAIVIPTGLALMSIVVSATDTVKITWKNNTFTAIAPPAASVWQVAVLGNFIRS